MEYQMHIDSAKRYGEENLKQDIRQVLGEILRTGDEFIDIDPDLRDQYVALITKITYLPPSASLAAFGMELMYTIMTAALWADDAKKNWLSELARQTLAYYRFYVPEET